MSLHAHHLKLIILIIVTTLGVASSTLVAQATSLSVSLSVGLTYFSIEGFTSPNAFVTLKENGAVIATTVAAADGSFTIATLGEDGVHTYSIYATDTGGTVTSTHNETVSLTPGSTTTLSNFIMAPTLHVEDTTLMIGEDLHLYGMSVPESQILILFDNNETTTVTVDINGNWSASLSTGSWSAGVHPVSAKAIVGGGYTSDLASSITVVLEKAADQISVPESTPKNSVPPTTSATPKSSRIVPGWFSFYDSDGNGILDLGNASTIFKNWATSLRDYLQGSSDATLKNGPCDLNQDGKCNMYDFSILLYYIDRKI